MERPQSHGVSPIPFHRSDPMKLRVRAELVYSFDPPTDAIYKIQVAHWPGQ